MSFFSRKPEQTRPPETLTVPLIVFLGEQAGPVEDSIKARFRQMFTEFPDVRSAYLARLSYPYHPAAPYQCGCHSERFKVAVGFEVSGDSEEPEDTSWFALAVQCEKCGKRQVIFDDETT